MGKAAVLIPSPYVAHNHQEYNARYLEKNGAAAVISEQELSGEKLLLKTTEILKNEASLEKMRAASKAIGIKDACETIYKTVKELTR